MNLHKTSTLDEFFHNSPGALCGAWALLMLGEHFEVPKHISLILSNIKARKNVRIHLPFFSLLLFNSYFEFLRSDEAFYYLHQ